MVQFLIATNYLPLAAAGGCVKEKGRGDGDIVGFIMSPSLLLLISLPAMS
jgi:hypothetical protein